MSTDLPTELSVFEWGRMPAMTALWVESWQEAMPEIDFELRRGWICHRIGALLDDGARVLVATETGGGTVVGFVSVHPFSGYIDQLVVHPDRWGAGVARRLMDAAQTHSPLFLALDVNEENRRAVRFYQKAGFTVAGQGQNPTSGRPTLRLEWRSGAFAPTLAGDQTVSSPLSLPSQ